MSLNEIEIENGKSGVDVYIDFNKLPLGPSLKVRNHSPTGFNVGYGGSGPAQLALAILLYFTSEAIARRYYQDFKWEFVSHWKADETYTLDVQQWINHKVESEVAA